MSRRFCFIHGFEVFGGRASCGYSDDCDVGDIVRADKRVLWEFVPAKEIRPHTTHHETCQCWELVEVKV